METTQFIDQLAAGEANQAKETLTDILSAKAFEALENRKIEIAKSALWWCRTKPRRRTSRY